MNAEHTRIFEDAGFLHEVANQAAWRRLKAAEYPEDDRNVKSADALDALAEWINTHSDHVVVGELAAALDGLYADPDYGITFVPTVCDRLGRYGFHHEAPESPETFLADLVAAIAREHAS
jgi:hypothetical protein